LHSIYKQVPNTYDVFLFISLRSKWPPGERDTNTSVAFDELVDEILEDEALERLFQSIVDADIGDENRALNE